MSADGKAIILAIIKGLIIGGPLQSLVTNIIGLITSLQCLAAMIKYLGRESLSVYTLLLEYLTDALNQRVDVILGPRSLYKTELAAAKTVILESIAELSVGVMC